VNDLVRKQLYITREQENMLKKKAEKMGVTQAELVREALDSHTYTIDYSRRNTHQWEEEIKYIESERRGLKEPQKGRTWKREELYDR